MASMIAGLHSTTVNWLDSESIPQTWTWPIKPSKNGLCSSGKMLDPFMRGCT
jgi:hypothetical protein